MIPFAVIEGRDLAPMLVAITCFVGLFATIIVRTLVRHQQRMTELLRGPTVPNEAVDELRALRNEMALLRDRVNDMSIKLDGQSLPNIPSAVNSAELQRIRGRA
jgi:hypothetical protein